MTPPLFIQAWFDNMNVGPDAAAALTTVISALLTLILALGAFYVSRRMLRTIVIPFFQRTDSVRDNVLVENNLFERLTLLVPALVIQFFIPIVLEASLAGFVGKLVDLYFIVVAVLALAALVNTLNCFYQTLKVSGDIPLTGLFQVFKIVIYFGGSILFVSIVFNRAPVLLFSGLGAMTAVLMLIFKDPILGFVAGIQLISNRMLKQGDWIEMPKYGADGDVIEITLTTVKVRNWDKTITTIPTYALISDSFKNWRGMQESSGRRIKRAIYIDMNTISFCTPPMIARFIKIRYIADYMQQKNAEIEHHNSNLGDEAREPANSRRLTNIGTFRAYVRAYLHNHPMINTDMTFLVRQLQPTDHGLPLEIYVFCRDKVWANYEAIQSDIFDHLLAILPEFDLRVFQYPSGNDVAAFTRQTPMQAIGETTTNSFTEN